MVEKESESDDLERLCQGVTPGDAACNYPATVHGFHISSMRLTRVAMAISEQAPLV